MAAAPLKVTQKKTVCLLPVGLEVIMTMALSSVRMHQLSSSPPSNDPHHRLHHEVYDFSFPSVGDCPSLAVDGVCQTELAHLSGTTAGCPIYVRGLEVAAIIWSNASDMDLAYSFCLHMQRGDFLALNVP